MEDLKDDSHGKATVVNWLNFNGRLHTCSYNNLCMGKTIPINIKKRTNTKRNYINILQCMPYTIMTKQKKLQKLPYCTNNTCTCFYSVIKEIIDL